MICASGDFASRLSSPSRYSSVHARKWQNHHTPLLNSLRMDVHSSCGSHGISPPFPHANDAGGGGGYRMPSLPLTWRTACLSPCPASLPVGEISDQNARSGGCLCYAALAAGPQKHMPPTKKTFLILLCCGQALRSRPCVAGVGRIAAAHADGTTLQLCPAKVAPASIDG